MKKIIVILVSVLVGAFATAKADKPATSSVVITNTEGSAVFKLHYQSPKTLDVKVSVLDNKGNKIFAETIKKTDGFARAYNFKELSEGQYTIAVEDENGKTLEKVNYEKIKIEKWVKISKVKDNENKFSLVVSSSRKDVVTISVFDSESNLVHSETQEIDGSFAKIYNIKGIDSFTFEVADSNGVVKSIKY